MTLLVAAPLGSCCGQGTGSDPTHQAVAVGSAQELQLPLPLPQEVLRTHDIPPGYPLPGLHPCLLYTSDAADE